MSYLDCQFLGSLLDPVLAAIIRSFFDCCFVENYVAGLTAR